MNSSPSSYKKLFELSKNAHYLSSIQSLIEWDQETYMPSEAITLRSSQIEILAHLIHKNKTSKQFAKTLDALIDIKTGEIKNDKLSSSQIAALREWRRDYLRTVKLPASFVKLFAKTTANASHAWKAAKQHNDFHSFSPHLEKVVSLCRKKADILGFEEHPYDALLDLYEPEAKTSYLTALFEKLKLDLQELLKEILSKPQIKEDFLYCYCPKYKQLEFCNVLLNKMGFDEESARLDLSAHPFCTGLFPKDTRMTTGVHPDNIFFAIFAVLHEGGHGLYNRGLPPEYYGSPLCEPISLGIDESQSRWWETLIGQSYSFWQYFYPLLQEKFPEQFQSIPLQDFYRAINAVKPGFIRIESDEVTYNLHVIVRFEIEKGLIEGKIKPKDLPEIWNEKMRENLGIAPQYDGEGCLQDIHWSLGFIGYFPTYTLGNLYASQFFQCFKQDYPQWEEKVAGGHLDFIREWLHKHIHQYGRQYTPTELCKKITGKPLSEMPFIDYLKQKYKSLYTL
ncbi:MAG TPA: carboxypeptidase M32 [Rhabdochlamydiaceae bacterium]|jgi:carboxypeptidase Taq